METRASVVIIGAGIVGSAAAHFLSDLGWRDVVVIDQGPLFATGGSTSHAPGLVFQTNGSKTMTQFARETVELFASLEHDGQACWYGVGSLEVATTPARWADLRRKLGWARSWGLDASVLTPAETRAKLDLIDDSVISGAYYVPTDGVANPVWAAEELARSARGVAFYPTTAVLDIETDGGRVRAVVTNNGRIETEQVLVCCGIWGPCIGRMVGVPIPLAPVEHQLAWTTPLPELAGETAEVKQPILRHQDQDLYFRQRRDHYAVGGYGHEPVVVDPRDIRPHGAPDDMPASNPFDAEAFVPAWEAAVELIPALRQVEIASAINGMFSFTPDGFPLLGESDRVRGVWLAEAIWITHAGGAAKAIAQLMTFGRADVDLRESHVNRFDAYVTTDAYVRERGAQQYREIYNVIHPLQPLEQPRPLRRSPFYGAQRDLGAVFFESRGWEAPRWYEANARLVDRYEIPPRAGWAGKFWSPIAGAEHLATRERAALFDMSPLPKIEVTGPAAAEWLEGLTSNKVARKPGSVTYALLLDEKGGIRSDITVARLDAATFQIGANGPADVAWLRRFLPQDGRTVQVRDVTGALACIGLWGPRARDVVERVSGDDWSNSSFPYYTMRVMAVGEVPVRALRVSYVGELGWELYTSPEYGARLWELLWAAGQPDGLVAAGRAAFDTLRLEKGYRLWGADMHTEYRPDEAGVGFAVKLSKESFIGRDALQVQGQGTSSTPERRLCCLQLIDPAVVVMGKEPVLLRDEVLGYVTSAGFGYSTGESLAYAYLPTACAEEGTVVEVQYFGDRFPATVVSEPRWDPEGTRLRV
jgi:glycine cleavage system aminomethyltransferase T/glycine/D-amino acid oxidase-like deaminating enzyme